MRSSSTLAYGFLLSASMLVLLGAGPGCSGGDPGGDGSGGNANNPGAGGGGFGGGLGDKSTGSSSCNSGLCLQRVACENGGDTTVSGVVYDPAGRVPIYNAFVFVPNAPLDPIKSGASCDRCDGTSNVYSGSPVSYAQTDDTGHFTLPNVPVGANIPLVVQVGKWRREDVTISVQGCQDNVLTDPKFTRLPKNSKEGHIPLIAITTGGADSMECLPRRMGIDDSEFSTAGGSGRIQLFQGDDRYQRNVDGTIATDENGKKTALARATSKFDSSHGGRTLKTSTHLWSSKDSLAAYDMVMLSCEGDVNAESKPQSARDALYEYEKAGGRVFASHWHRVWFSDGPNPVPSVATGASNGGWSSTAPQASNGAWLDQADDGNGPPQTAIINDKFVKGAAFADWLQSVGATTTRGELDVAQPRNNLSSIDHKKAQDWATIPHYHASMLDANGNETSVATTPAKAVQFMSYNAPIGASKDQVCGRAIFTDLHVSGGDHSDNVGANKPFPSGCDEDMELSPQEKALEFMLFDVSSCISSDEGAPPPPIH